MKHLPTLSLLLLLGACTAPEAQLQESYQRGFDEGYDEGYNQAKQTFSDLHLQQALASGAIDSAAYLELVEE